MTVLIICAKTVAVALAQAAAALVLGWSYCRWGTRPVSRTGDTGTEGRP